MQGPISTYESIVKGEPSRPGIPSSFRVLVKELQSLGLSVEAITEDGETITFGKEDDLRAAQQQKTQSTYTRPPRRKDSTKRLISSNSIKPAVPRRGFSFRIRLALAAVCATASPAPFWLPIRQNSSRTLFMGRQQLRVRRCYR